MRRRRPAHELRIAIDCLPLSTRKAMLDGMQANRIIVGAYVDGRGGICPMLAAHRHGGRTSLASFAHAWDRYTRVRRPRPASDRELLTLSTMLEASIGLDEPDFISLSDAVREHMASMERPAAEPSAREPEQPRRDTGERHRAAELGGQEGWSWMRPFRRYDEYQLALRELRMLEHDRERRAEKQREREPV